MWQVHEGLHQGSQPRELHCQLRILSLSRIFFISDLDFLVFSERDVSRNILSCKHPLMLSPAVELPVQLPFST